MKYLALLFLSVVFHHTTLAQTPSPNTPKFDQFVVQFAGVGFENDVEKYAKKEPTTNRVVFAGSSTFTNWGDQAEQRFASYGVVNRGIGGSDIRHQIRHAEELVFKYSPKIVVFYIGENDITRFSPAQFREYFECWVDNLFWRFPYTKLVLISLKPSPARTAKHPLYQHINAQYAVLASLAKNIYFLNIDDTIATNPSAFFLPDNLHLNQAGYDLLTERLIPILDQINATEDPS